MLEYLNREERGIDGPAAAHRLAQALDVEELPVELPEVAVRGRRG